MLRIGPVENGLGYWHRCVWLCWRPGCGHEREEWDGRLSLVYWRWELIGTLWLRALSLRMRVD